ncbi:class I SAM-dependent methyltransferase [Marinospirillum alkaliphilum]|uniref:Methyltransferase domain-containing protein n=1 Tax=Marinospirillum alkaliphilum DSM 21637 TaxID=1122209 RepID=A0A1K1WZM1_9GAMM|nr:class I SAM-dependent methyltransferase [Marinospirillum alkaliphilum]SFX42499.1 Methyltransferase domain-containing protein [Marinospirillum alkaliphilum DSM 21637]
MHVQKAETEMTPGCWQSWQKFWQSTLGQAVLEAETALLKPLLQELHGYHLLTLGSCPVHDLVKDCGIRHQIEWRPSVELADTPSCLIADPCLLPLPDDSMDLVLLHHSLELFTSPHALLKEAARITLPKGEMMILSFNPNSLWGLSRLLPAGLQAEPVRELQGMQLLSQTRLTDWLEFLDMYPDEARHIFHRPPCNREKLQQKLKQLDQKLDRRDWPFAGIYLLRVRKRIGSPLRRVVGQKNTGWLPVQPVSSPTRSSLKTEK